MTHDPNKLTNETDFTIVVFWRVLKKWRESDTYPWMKQMAVTYIAPRAALGISLIALFVHFIWAIYTKCGVNFQRGGSIVALSAAALYAFVDWHDPKTALLSGKRINRLRILGPYIMLPILAAIGTIVWGYGDLIPFFGNSGCKA